MQHFWIFLFYHMEIHLLTVWLSWLFKVAKLMWVSFVSLWLPFYSLCVYNHTGIWRFINCMICSCSTLQGGNEKWQLLSNIWSIYPNSYEKNNMKFDLNACTKVKFIVNDQGRQLWNQGYYGFLLNFLHCLF